MTVARFPKPESVGPRQWGEELLIDVCPGHWSLKEIRMNRGAEGGLQKHHLKDEAGYMLYGEILVRYDDGTGKLADRVVTAGQSFRFPPGAVHKAIALTDAAYIEVSTPHFNDRVHVEILYGIEKEAGGLPSTSLEEVELR